MIGRMVWWESAAAPKKGEQAPRIRAQTRGRQILKSLKANGLLGLFGCARRAGFVRSAQPLWVRSDARRLEFPDGPPATGPMLDGRWEFYPISAAVTTSI